MVSGRARKLVSWRQAISAMADADMVDAPASRRRDTKENAPWVRFLAILFFCVLGRLALDNVIHSCPINKAAAARCDSIVCAPLLFLQVEKYRPATLDDVAAHRDIIDTSAPGSAPLPPPAPAPLLPLLTHPAPRPSPPRLAPPRAPPRAHPRPPPAVSRLTKEDRLPHLLLYGPPGTGKTSTILCGRPAAPHAAATPAAPPQRSPLAGRP